MDKFHEYKKKNGAKKQKSKTFIVYTILKIFLVWRFFNIFAIIHPHVFAIDLDARGMLEG